MLYSSYISGCGSYLPKKIIKNNDLPKKLNTNDNWIITRTGIKQRYIASKKQLNSDLAYEAAKNALRNSKIKVSEIDLVIVATSTPDNTFPSTATKIQGKLGIKKGFAFDIQAACSGFIYALSVADNYILNNQAKNVLVIGSEIFSRILDWNDRSTCVLFGDGAGAIILSKKTSLLSPSVIELVVMRPYVPFSLINEKQLKKKKIPVLFQLNCIQMDVIMIYYMLMEELLLIKKQDLLK